MTPAATASTAAEAHQRYSQWWDVYYGVVAVAVAAAILVVNDHALWRRLLAAGAIALMVVVHLVIGRRVIERDVSSVVLASAQIALFAAAVTFIPFASWLLFAIIPMLFMLVPIRSAIVLVIAVNLVAPLRDAILSPGYVRSDLVIALISAATGIWLGFWVSRVIQQNKERGLLIAELEASRAEVARLSHETGVAAERARLAGEIHDTLAQGFTSIITLLQAADPALKDERLALAVRTAKENLAESRALVAALAPAALSEGSLPDSVRRQAARFAEETGTPATVRVTGEERPLPTKVEVVLLRAAQEALTNVRRHAGAQEAAVLLAYAPSSVRLVVRDDGRGFDQATADGFGLNGMRARADQVQGRLTVHSDPETGTTIELEVPA
ncbi:sensor histidine kinase [Actinoplanes subtropicus]|uniref:sensor histidine kinase n=1 Tax=Actinoplanes subtropicus TaxID=543632 RepID=UPI0004C35D92|nr:sensor histidine kinase [Actinoplanes subtropicus]